MEDHPEYTLEQINEELRRRLPEKPAVCKTSVRKLLSGQLITLKKLETAAQQRNRDDVKMARRIYAEWLMEFNEEILFVDESSFHLWLSRTQGRARRGTRATRVVNGRRGPHFSIIIAVSNRRGLVHHTVHNGGTMQELFNNFLEKTSVAAGDDVNLFYVMDNASCHRRAQEANIPGNHHVRFLPAYSPFLNIAENAFSTWKAAVKRQMAEVHQHLLEQPHAEQLATLSQIAEQNVGEISARRAMRWYRRTRRYIAPCIRLEEIHEAQ